MQQQLQGDVPVNGKQEVIFDPQHSRPLNSTVWTEDPALVGLVQEIWDEHLAAGEAEKQKGGKKPRRPYIEQLRVLVTDLYLAWQEDPFLCLGMPFSEGAWDSQSRYNPLGLSKHLVVLVKQLQAAGLVRVSAGSYAAPGAKGNRTGRIQASTELQKQFKVLVVDSRAIQVVPSECIILKTGEGEHSRAAEYQDTDDTLRMRQVLTAYNGLLARTFIDIPTLDDPWVIRQDNTGRSIRVSIGHRHQLVRRIFSRGSWEMNGRFYGPWWQGLNSRLRSQIFINDTPTVEIDFKAMHIQILAAQKGVELPPDPYELPPGQFPNTDPKEQRRLVKQLVLTALNAKDTRSACSAFREGLEAGHAGKHLKNATLQRTIDAFSEHVPALADSLCSDVGIRLMFTDSQIMERVITHCTLLDLPVLTIHDSAIVPYTHSKELEAAMIRAAVEVAVREIPLEAKALGLDAMQDDPVYVRQNFQIRCETERCEGYLTRLKEWEDTAEREVVPFRLLPREHKKEKN